MNQIAPSRLGGFDDRLIDLFMLDVQRVQTTPANFAASETTPRSLSA